MDFSMQVSDRQCVVLGGLLLQDAARNGKGKLTADVQMYAQTAVEVAIAKGVPYVDMYNIIMGIKSWDVSERFKHPKVLHWSSHSCLCITTSWAW